MMLIRFAGGNWGSRCAACCHGYALGVRFFHHLCLCRFRFWRLTGLEVDMKLRMLRESRSEAFRLAEQIRQTLTRSSPSLRSTLLRRDFLQRGLRRGESLSVWVLGFERVCGLHALLKQQKFWLKLLLSDLQHRCFTPGVSNSIKHGAKTQNTP